MDRNIRWLSFGAVVRAAGVSLILPFVALYLRNVLHLGFVEIGLLVALLGILPLGLYPFGGTIADRLGRRTLFLASLAAEALGVLGTGVAMRFDVLPGVLAAVFAVSVSGSLGGPALSAYIADLASGPSRTEGFTWFRIGWNLGFTAGVVSGGALIGFFGFSTIGLAAGAVLIASTGFLALVLEPTRRRDRARGVPRPNAAGPGAARGGTLRLIASNGSSSPSASSSPWPISPPANGR